MSTPAIDYVSTVRASIQAMLDREQKEATFTNEDDLFAAGILDSFGLWDLLAELEQEFGAKVPEGEATPATFATVAKTAEYFAKLSGADWTTL